MNPIFDPDEMNLVQAPRDWSAQKVLNHDGIFYLKDIVTTLDLDAAKLKRKVREMRAAGRNPWREMGVRKIWNHWVVRMTVFAPYYRKHLVSKVRRLEPSWDGNALLTQKGLFHLADVCKLIPFSAHQLRYQAKRRAHSRREIGVFKDAEVKGYLVDMEIFAGWILVVWRETEGMR